MHYHHASAGGIFILLVQMNSSPRIQSNTASLHGMRSALSWESSSHSRRSDICICQLYIQYFCSDPPFYSPLLSTLLLFRTDHVLFRFYQLCFFISREVQLIFYAAYINSSCNTSGQYPPTFIYYNVGFFFFVLFSVHTAAYFLRFSLHFISHS